MWIENVVGRVRIERRYSIFTISGVELERERETDRHRERELSKRELEEKHAVWFMVYPAPHHDPVCSHKRQRWHSTDYLVFQDRQAFPWELLDMAS